MERSLIKPSPLGDRTMNEGFDPQHGDRCLIYLRFTSLASPLCCG